MRIGQGYDIHPLVAGRPLMLGGVKIPSSFGELGVSDGDVLIHAVIDALLGACALGDIGSLFPPSQKEYKDISSRILLERALGVTRQNGYRLINLDSTVILESPKLFPYIERIRDSLASDLDLPKDAVSVKAKTKEGMDSVGRNLAVEAVAVVLVEEV